MYHGFMPYAHAAIEWFDEDGQKRYFETGAEVGPKDDIPGYDELVEAGTIRDEKYDPANEPKLLPKFVEIDGVRYERQQEDSDAAA
jgi:hypothetical protein